MTSTIAESTYRPVSAATPIRLRPWIPLLFGASVLGWCYRETLAALPDVWATDPNSSHGYLVPAFSLFFAWQAWREHGWPIRAGLDNGQALAGLSRVGIAWIVHCLFILIPQFAFFDVLSLLLALSGLLILLGGRAGYRPYAFAVWFLAFAAQLPEIFYHWLVLHLQQAASVVAAVALDTFLVPVVREGNYLHLPEHVLEVGVGCSGLRGLIGTLALALAMGHLLRETRWFRWTLAILAVPVALAANSLRLILTGVIAYELGPRFIQGAWHDMEGLVTTGLGMGLLFTAAWLLGHVRQVSGWRRIFPSAPVGTLPRPVGTESVTSLEDSMSLNVRCWIVLAVLAGGLAGQELLRAHLTGVPLPAPAELRLPLAALPRQIGPWEAEDLPLTEQIQYADEHLKRRYHLSERDQSLVLWAVYARDGEDRKHHPEVCMAVAGRQEERQARQTFDPGGPGGLVQQYLYRGLAGGEWIFYWHYTLPIRLEPNLDALQRAYQRSRCRASSVTLEVFAAARTPQDLEAVQQFVRDLDTAVRGHVGSEAVRGSERLPVTVTGFAREEREPP